MYETQPNYYDEVERGGEELLREKVKNQFEISVASLGDIYKFSKEEEEQKINPDDVLKKGENVLGYDEMLKQLRSWNRSRREDRRRQIRDGEGSADIKNVYLGGESTFKNVKNSNKTFKNFVDENSRNLITVSYLKSGKLPEPKKYQHVKQGKINPPKASFSLKPGTDKKIEEHEKKMKEVVLYSSPVKIEYQLCHHKREISPIKTNEGGYSSVNPDEGGYSNVVVVGGPPVNTSNFVDMHNQTQRLNTTNRGRSNYNPNRSYSLNKTNKSHMYPGEKTVESSRVERNIQKQYENLYAYTKDFFVSNANKVPSRGGIDDIIQHAEEMERSLEKYKKKVEEEKSKNKGSGYILKDSIVTRGKEDKKKDFVRQVIKPRPKKQYLEIDPEERKKIEEKLEMLHLEIRTTFDTLKNAKLDEKDEKVETLVKKCQFLGRMLKTFSSRLKGETNSTKFYSSNNMTNNHTYESFNPNQSQNFSNTMYQSANPNQTGDNNQQMINTQNNNQNNLLFSNEIYHSRGDYPVVENMQNNDHNINNNFNQTQSVTNTNPYESQSNFYQSQNQFNPQNEFNNQFQQSQTQFQNSQNNFNRSEDVDNAIDILKGNMSNLQVDDNRMVFGSRMSGFGPGGNNNVNQSQNQIQMPGYSNLKNTVLMNNNTQQEDMVNTNNASLIGYNSSMQNFNQNNQQNIQQNNNNPSYNSNPITSFDHLTPSEIPDLNSNQSEFPIINTKNVTRDGRFASYDIQLPIDYYYNMTKTNEPPKDKDWYLRPHHIETVSRSPNAIPDDLMNTKYISYYSPVEKPENQKNREEVLSEVITTMEENIEKLKIDLFKKATLDKDFGKIYKNLEGMKEEVKKNYEPGQVIREMEIKKGKITSLLSDRSNQKMGFSDMFSQNEDIQQTNMAITGYEVLLDEIRKREKKIILDKRKEEYERIRPPVERWWELKGADFQNELQRNKMVLNAPQSYFKKLKELQSDNLY